MNSKFMRKKKWLVELQKEKVNCSLKNLSRPYLTNSTRRKQNVKELRNRMTVGIVITELNWAFCSECKI